MQSSVWLCLSPPNEPTARFCLFVARSLRQTTMRTVRVQQWRLPPPHKALPGGWGSILRGGRAKNTTGTIRCYWLNKLELMGGHSASPNPHRRHPPPMRRHRSSPQRLPGEWDIIREIGALRKVLVLSQSEGGWRVRPHHCITRVRREMMWKYANKDRKKQNKVGKFTMKCK